MNCESVFKKSLITFLFTSLLAPLAQAKPKAHSPVHPQNKVAKAVVKKAKPAPAARRTTETGDVKKVAFLNSARGPANDPNRAIEVRGQSRNLSMMLVLKNGKDSIDFIKVRKNYTTEINATEF